MSDALDLWTLANVAAKAALYLGVLGAAGLVFCALVFDLREGPRAALRFAGLGLAASAVSFALKGAALTGDASGMTDPEMLGLLWQTQSGTALAWQIAGLGALMVGLALGAPGLWLAGAGGAVALGSFSGIGHIADLGQLGLLLLLLAHLVGVALWIGILIPLRRRARQSDSLAKAADLGARFGRVAQVVVPGLIVAGVVMAYALVGSVAALVGSGYGRMLLVKVALVALLLGLAALNKWRFVPALAAGEARAGRALARSIALEWAVIGAMVVVTAVLTTALSLPSP